MGRSRTRALGAAPTGQPGQFLGVPATYWFLGLGAAAGIAWLSAGSDDEAVATGTTPASSGSTPASSGSSSGSTSGNTSGSTSTSTTIPKKKRQAIVGAASPQLFVYVNSVGGEGIFDRLTTTFHVLDGYGLTRIATLANYEFAGYDTGVSWKEPSSGRVYIKLYKEINNVPYNYWIEKSETVAMHSNGVAAAMAAGYQWGGLSIGRVFNMTAASLLAIKNFYWNNYIL
jgi:hypothetical protein